MRTTVLMVALACFGMSGCSSDNGDDACGSGEYRCTDTVLERCDDGAFTEVEDCAGKGMCMADMGHCHMGGMGGMHMGGMGGMHMGGMSMGGMGTAGSGG